MHQSWLSLFPDEITPLARHHRVPLVPMLLNVHPGRRHRRSAAAASGIFSSSLQFLSMIPALFSRDTHRFRHDRGLARGSHGPPFLRDPGERLR
ncbi:MAG: hypothetical protein MZV70_44935 [Desulfobacterales bacterium]|nr:hypothetical protein [Desulfobacterales bacterium]